MAESRAALMADSMADDWAAWKVCRKDALTAGSRVAEKGLSKADRKAAMWAALKVCAKEIERVLQMAESLVVLRVGSRVAEMAVVLAAETVDSTAAVLAAPRVLCSAVSTVVQKVFG